MSRERYLADHCRFVHAFLRGYAAFLVLGIATAVILGIFWLHPAARSIGIGLCGFWIYSLIRCMVMLQREGKHCRQLPERLDSGQAQSELQYILLHRQQLQREKNFFQLFFLIGLMAMVFFLLTGLQQGLTGIAIALVITTTIEQVILLIYHHDLAEYIYQLEKRL